MILFTQKTYKRLLITEFANIALLRFIRVFCFPSVIQSCTSCVDTIAAESPSQGSSTWTRIAAFVLRL